MPQLPSGTVTFVFSDIEGSTALLKRLGDEAYGELLAAHRRLVRESFGRHGGQEIDTQGDAFFYSFARARAAVAAAVEVQRAHAGHDWPEGATVLLRLGLHTGEPAVGEEGYTGLDVVRASRIAASGAGGQILLSESTRAIVAGDLPDGVQLRSLGSRRLKDIEQPEPMSELVIEGLPRTADARAEEPRAAGAQAADDPGATGLALGTTPDAVPFLAGLEPGSKLTDWVRDTTDRLLPASNRLIEKRVLAQIEQSFAERSRELEERRRQKARTRGRRAESIADEIAKLQALRESGALTEEQYERAVERALESDRSGAD